MPSHKILSLDQAAKVTGWAVFENDKLIEHGSFSVPSAKPIEQRLQLFIAEMNKLYQAHDTADEIFFEDIQLQGNAETYKKLAYIQAALMIWCYNNNLKFTILAPSHWRSVIKGKYKDYNFGRSRNEQKQKAIQFCQEVMGVEATSDEADAICIGCAGLIESKYQGSAF